LFRLDEIEYNVHDGDIASVSRGVSPVKLLVPSFVKSEKRQVSVVAVGPDAFRSHLLKKIRITKTVEIIGRRAFACCQSGQLDFERRSLLRELDIEALADSSVPRLTTAIKTVSLLSDVSASSWKIFASIQTLRWFLSQGTCCRIARVILFRAVSGADGCHFPVELCCVARRRRRLFRFQCPSDHIPCVGNSIPKDFPMPLGSRGELGIEPTTLWSVENTEANQRLWSCPMHIWCRHLPVPVQEREAEHSLCMRENESLSIEVPEIL
jgi:hypothetical protein